MDSTWLQVQTLQRAHFTLTFTPLCLPGCLWSGQLNGRRRGRRRPGWRQLAGAPRALKQIQSDGMGKGATFPFNSCFGQILSLQMLYKIRFVRWCLSHSLCNRPFGCLGCRAGKPRMVSSKFWWWWWWWWQEQRDLIDTRG